MKSNRNYEGYHDPTTCEAIRRSHSQRKNKLHLKYRIGEVESFRRNWTSEVEMDALYGHL